MTNRRATHGAGTDAIRRIVYFGSHGITQHIVVAAVGGRRRRRHAGRLGAHAQIETTGLTRAKTPRAHQ
jgi:hypothetical protein